MLPGFTANAGAWRPTAVTVVSAPSGPDTSAISLPDKATWSMVLGTAAPLLGSTATGFISTTDNKPTNSGMTILVSASVDDGNAQAGTSPFSIYVYGTGYTAPFPGSNTYITMGSGSSNFSGLTISGNPAIPGVHLGGADNSWQRVWYKVGTNTLRIRYEGNSSTSGTPGNPGIVYECTFFKQFDTYQYIEIRFGVHGRTAGTFGFTKGDGVNFVSGGTITANQSYVIRTDTLGNSPTINAGYYMA